MGVSFLSLATVRISRHFSLRSEETIQTEDLTCVKVTEGGKKTFFFFLLRDFSVRCVSGAAKKLGTGEQQTQELGCEIPAPCAPPPSLGCVQGKPEPTRSWSEK